MSVPPARSMVLVTHYFPAHGGGIEIVASQIAARLAGSGAWTIAWFASDVDPEPDVVPGLMTTAARSWNAVERRTGLPFPLWSIGSLRALWVAVRDADLVHVHDYLYLGNLAAIIAGWRWGKPVVVTQHIGLIPFASRIKRLTLELLNRTIGALFLRHVHQVGFISEAVRTYFEARVTFTRRPAYLPNGVDGVLFHPRRQQRVSSSVRSSAYLGTARFCSLSEGSWKRRVSTSLRSWRVGIRRTRGLLQGVGRWSGCGRGWETSACFPGDRGDTCAVVPGRRPACVAEHW